MSQYYAPPPPPSAYPPAAPPKTKRSTNCCMGCCLGVVGLFLLPGILLLLYVMTPVDATPSPLPDSWQVGGPQLEATWSVPTSREIGYEQLTISPWLLTAKGPIFLAQEEHQVRFERWTDGKLEAKYTPTDFWAFDGVAHGDALVLIGENKKGDPSLLQLDAMSLTERSRVDIAASVIPPEEFHGAELVPWPGEQLGLLLEAKTEAAVLQRSEGIAPLQFAWLDPETGEGTIPFWGPASLFAELPDYGLYQRNPSPTLYTCWMNVGGSLPELQLRPTESGVPAIGYVVAADGEQFMANDPEAQIDVDAADKAVEQQQGDRHFHRHWTQPLQYPPVVVSLDAGNYTMPAQITGGWPSPSEWLYLARLKADEMKGGLELQMQQFTEGVEVRGLQLHHADNIDVPIDVVDPSLTEAIQNELAIAGSAPYALAGWRGDQLLILHAVLFPPKGIYSGDPILRLGTIDVPTGSLTWHGWMPFPKQLQERILTLERWRIAVYDDTLIITVHQGATVEHFPKKQRCPHVMLGATVTLPDTLGSAWYGELETTY